MSKMSLDSWEGGMVTSNPKHVIADFPHIWALFDHEKSKYSVF